MRTKIVSDERNLIDIIEKSNICFVSMVDEQGLPYVLPFNFGFKNNLIYLHSGNEGRKVDILKSNPNVCIAFSNSEELAYQDKDVACSHFMKYRSVLVYGKVKFIENKEDKIDALNIIMKHYTGREDYKYNDPAINNVLVFTVEAEKKTGKIMGY
ncbi:MAG: MFS transporter [Marinilabiliales bacterium]|mgnify:CR=1 FL=1|nr:MAG: MFS transporter [Marinilabiliales bacterium]